jgi:hypothetical protein
LSPLQQDWGRGLAVLENQSKLLGENRVAFEAVNLGIRPLQMARELVEVTRKTVKT